MRLRAFLSPRGQGAGMSAPAGSQGRTPGIAPPGRSRRPRLRHRHRPGPDRPGRRTRPSAAGRAAASLSSATRRWRRSTRRGSPPRSTKRACVQRSLTVPAGESSKEFGAFGRLDERLARPFGPTARRRWWRWAAAWSATSPALPPRCCCAASTSSRCRRRCWPRSIPRSAARPASTRAMARTWSAPSTSRAWCWPIPTCSTRCRGANCWRAMPRSPSTG